ncbi:hypothetical protein AAZX31_14G062000 [Glycine max]
MKRGILTSNSAGNSGPGFSSMLNYPPRILSVAAGTISRKFLTKVQLGNGMVFEGVSINTFDLKNKMFPMVYAGDVPNTAGGYNSSTCRYHNMNPYVIFPCLFFFQKKLKKGL